MKKKYTVIISVIVIIVLIGSIYYFRKNSKAQDIAYPNAVVTRGDISMKIDGTGNLDSNKSVITLKGSGVVKQITHNVGDTVKAGELLYVIQDDDLQNQLQNASLNLELAKEQLQNDTNSYNDALSKQNIVSNYSGKVTNINVKVGQQITPGTPIATISNPNGLATNPNAVMAQTQGTIKSINVSTGQNVSNGTVIATLSSNISDIQIKSDNIKVQQAQTSYNQVLDQINALKIYSPINGVLYSQNIKTGDDLSGQVNTGKSISSSANQNLNAGSGSSLAGQPSSTQANTDIGQLASLADQSETAIIVDNSQYSVDVPVDEVDINKIKIGQKVTLTTDDVPGKTFTGTVSSISSIPTIQNNVSSYNVTISINNDGSLKLGMTMNASILVDEKKDTLLLPIEAVQTNGNEKYVILDNGTNKGKNKRQRRNDIVKVQTGIYNEKYIEILSGLKEGDKVSIPAQNATSNTSNGGSFGGNSQGGSNQRRNNIFGNMR